MPNLVSINNPYHRRRPHERIIPSFKTELYHKSFIPATTELWNSLPDEIKTCDSIGAFKRFLSAEDPVIPAYFYHGDRKEQIIHCRLRLSISDLNHHLFLRHLQNDPSCTCGCAHETADHYLLSCPRFNVSRANTILNLPAQYRTCDILLNGGRELTIETNVLIFSHVHLFIATSNRF